MSESFDRLSKLNLSKSSRRPDDRLHQTTMAKLPASIVTPKYNRHELLPGILHLGSGAFHRTHLLDFTEDALENSFGPWGVMAVNLRPPNLAAMLRPQGGLYCRQLRCGAHRDTRLIGALLDGYTVTDEHNEPSAHCIDKALTLASSKQIKIVSMTVTEKGYCHVPATGELNTSHLDIAQDIKNPSMPRSIPGFLLESIRRRFAAGTPLPTFMSCDNVPANGRTLRNCVLQLAQMTSPELVSRIEDEAVFLNSMVDRIAPATQEEDLIAFRDWTGLLDLGLSIGEPFRMWAIENDSRALLPAWEQVGAIMTCNVHDYELIKMRVVNGMQTGLCHLGHLAGHRFMSDVLATPLFSQFARETITREVAPNLPKVQGLELDDYIDETVTRLENTALRHSTAQISTDGSQKIRHRLLDPLYDAHTHGMEIQGLTLAVSAWLAHLITLSTLKDQLAVSDPILPKARSIWLDAGGDTGKFIDEMTSMRSVFPERLDNVVDLKTHLKEKVDALLMTSVEEVLSMHIAGLK